MLKNSMGSSAEGDYSLKSGGLWELVPGLEHLRYSCVFKAVIFFLWLIKTKCPYILTTESALDIPSVRALAWGRRQDEEFWKATLRHKLSIRKEVWDLRYQEKGEINCAQCTILLSYIWTLWGRGPSLHYVTDKSISLQNGLCLPRLPQKMNYDWHEALSPRLLNHKPDAFSPPQCFLPGILNTRPEIPRANTHPFLCPWEVSFLKGFSRKGILEDRCPILAVPFESKETNQSAGEWSDPSTLL